MFEAIPDQLAALIEPHRRFFEVAASCHDLKDARSAAGPGWLGDPMEVALVQLAADAMPRLPHSPRVSEIPFDSQRKRLSTVHATPEGRCCWQRCARGRARAVRSGGDGWRLVELSADLVVTFRTAAEAMAEKGLRVLAFAWRELPESFVLAGAEAEMTLAGLIGLEDPPRPEVAAALQKCRDAGIKVIMVTGDHATPRRQSPRDRTGALRRARRDHRRATRASLGHPAPARARRPGDRVRVLAEQKMRIVGALKNKRELRRRDWRRRERRAGACRPADVGIAMGERGTRRAPARPPPSCCSTTTSRTIVAAIEEGRAVFANIRNFLTYILTSNVPELIPYLAFVIFRIPLPLTIIQILAVDLGTDMLPALGLGAEKPAPDIMKAPPRSRADRLLNWPLLARAYLFLGPMQAAAAISAYWFVLRNGGWHFGEQVRGTRPTLSASHDRLSQRHHRHADRERLSLCRSEREPLLARGLMSNRLILAGIAAEILLIASDRLHPVAPRALRHRVDRARRLALHHPLRARHARARRAA